MATHAAGIDRLLKWAGEGISERVVVAEVLPQAAAHSPNTTILFAHLCPRAVSWRDKGK